MKTYELTVKGRFQDYNYSITTALNLDNNITNVATAYIAKAGSRYSKFVEKAILNGNYKLTAL